MTLCLLGCPGRSPRDFSTVLLPSANHRMNLTAEPNMCFDLLSCDAAGCSLDTGWAAAVAATAPLVIANDGNASCAVAALREVLALAARASVEIPHSATRTPAAAPAAHAVVPAPTVLAVAALALLVLLVLVAAAVGVCVWCRRPPLRRRRAVLRSSKSGVKSASSRCSAACAAIAKAAPPVASLEGARRLVGCRSTTRAAARWLAADDAARSAAVTAQALLPDDRKELRRLQQLRILLKFQPR